MPALVQNLLHRVLPQYRMLGLEEYTCMQGLSGMGLEDDRLKDVMTQVSMASAFGSVVVGELPPMTKQQANALLADNSLLGSVKPIDSQSGLQVRHFPVKRLFSQLLKASKSCLNFGMRGYSELFRTVTFSCQIDNGCKGEA